MGLVQVRWLAKGEQKYQLGLPRTVVQAVHCTTPMGTTRVNETSWSHTAWLPG